MPKVKLPEGEGAVKLDGRIPQVCGDSGVKLQRPATHRVLEGQPLGVQPETPPGDRAAVERVGVYGMPDGREVDPDLVRPSRFEPYAEHGMPRRTREHGEVRDGRLAYAGGHEGRVIRIAADGGVDRPRAGQSCAVCDRPVETLHPPGRHHPDEPGVCRLAFRKHHQARGVAVEPVNHPGPAWILSPCYAPVQECVHERSRRVAGARMHHKPSWFVDDQDVLILEVYENRDIFGREALLRDPHLDALSAAHPVRRKDLLAIDEQEILCDQSLYETSAQAETPRRQPVETLSGLRGVYVESSGRHPAKAESRPYSRRRKKRLALKIRLSERSPCSLSKNSCELLSWASDGSSRSTSSAASGSVTGGSDGTGSGLSVSSCAVEGSTSGSVTSGSSAGGSAVSGSAVSGSAARGPLFSVRITSV